MLILKYCFFRWSRILVLPDHKLIIVFLKQYKEAECNSLETATVFKDNYRKENTNSEVKHLGLILTKLAKVNDALTEIYWGDLLEPN